MISASPRLGALFAGGAALVAFGLTGPALAESANGQCDGVTQNPGPYCSDPNDPHITESQNGNGNGKAAGRPPAGSVGNADDKNPPGQYPDGGDGNNGYECDGNSGIAKTNPAHTGCDDGGYQQPPPPDGEYSNNPT